MISISVFIRPRSFFGFIPVISPNGPKDSPYSQIGFPNGEEGQLASLNCQVDFPSGQTGSYNGRPLYTNGKRGPKMVKIQNIQKVPLGTVSRDETAVLLDFVQITLPPPNVTIVAVTG